MIGVEGILTARIQVRATILSEHLVEYIHSIVAATRKHPAILSGISTRGGIGLADASRAWAFLEGRDYVVPEDVKAVVTAVGAHRLILRPEHETADKESLLTGVVESIPVPRS
jgi:MoxR-like ATPase